MNSAWSQVKGKIGAGRAKEFFLSIRESWEECEKTNAKVGGGGLGDEGVRWWWRGPKLLR